MTEKLTRRQGYQAKAQCSEEPETYRGNPLFHLVHTSISIHPYFRLWGEQPQILVLSASCTSLYTNSNQTVLLQTALAEISNPRNPTLVLMQES